MRILCALSTSCSYTLLTRATAASCCTVCFSCSCFSQKSAIGWPTGSSLPSGTNCFASHASSFASMSSVTFPAKSSSLYASSTRVSVSTSSTCREAGIAQQAQGLAHSAERSTTAQDTAVVTLRQR
ncbi:hypothetical protein COO60DRAFT_586204 [Scenedesmus sp. NREL 46B-D3]|nr:hypothetical protein COO60DRAFT_586204 [Scenedesmus sp. NREL 46B-D3]